MTGRDGKPAGTRASLPAGDWAGCLPAVRGVGPVANLRTEFRRRHLRVAAVTTKESR